jgi:hypothetical protein
MQGMARRAASDLIPSVTFLLMIRNGGMSFYLFF